MLQGFQAFYFQSLNFVSHVKMKPEQLLLKQLYWFLSYAAEAIGSKAMSKKSSLCYSSEMALSYNLYFSSKVLLVLLTSTVA
jgi:hypothetical protein